MEDQHVIHADTVDERLTLLTNEHCRATIDYFRDSSDDVASLDDIADGITTQHHAEVDHLSLQLHHSVLPRLADANVVNYDTKTKLVHYHGDSDLEALLDGIQGTIR